MKSTNSGSGIIAEQVGALKQLIRHPGFLTVGVVSLSIGIAASDVVLSFINATRTANLPYRNASELVEAVGYDNSTCLPRCAELLSPALVNAWRAQSRTVVGIASARVEQTVLNDDSGERPIIIAQVDSAFFPSLGPAIIAGRAPTVADFADGTPLIVLGAQLWRRVFGADAKVLGRTLQLKGTAVTIVGIAPENANYPGRVDAWVVDPSQVPLDQAVPSLQVVARLRPGVSKEAASHEVNALAVVTAPQGLDRSAVRAATVLPMNWLAKSRSGDSWIVLSAIVVTLLIACANIATLTLARTLAREREFAIRLALGASPSILARRIIFEAVTMSTLAGAVGFSIASLARSVAVGFGEKLFGYPVTATLDWSVLLITILASALLGTVIGAAGALWVLRQHARNALRDSGPATGTGSARARRVMAGSQVAIVLVLVSGALLLSVMMSRIRELDVGYDANHLITVGLVPVRSDLDPSVARIEQRGLVDRATRLSGVRSASLYSTGYPRSSKGPGPVLNVEGATEMPSLTAVPPYDYRISADFFRTLGIKVIRGRDFGPSDNAASASVAIINERASRLWFGDRDPIGKRLTLRSSDVGPAAVIVVGIVPNTAVIGKAAVFGALNNKEQFPLIFRPTDQVQIPSSVGILLVRTVDAPEPLEDAATRLVSSSHFFTPYGVTDLRAALSAFGPLESASVRTLFVVAIASVGCALAILGVVGVTLDTAQRRRTELGIRLALGAPRTTIIGLVARDSIVVALGGASVGVLASLITNRFVAALIPGASNLGDFGVLAASALSVMTLAAVVSVISSANVSRINPVEAIRQG